MASLFEDAASVDFKKNLASDEANFLSIDTINPLSNEIKELEKKVAALEVEGRDE